MRHYSHRLMAVAAFALLGCPGTTPVDDRVSVGPRGDLESCQREIEPYDVNGRTLAGLYCLDEWIDDVNEPLLFTGLRLRAETLQNLWVFSQVAAGLDDRSSQATVALLAEYFDLDDDWARGELVESLSSAIGADLRAAQAEQAEIQIAEEVVRFDLAADEAAWQFGQWSSATYSGARLRLLLAALFFRHSGEWLHLFDGQPDAFYGRFAWLCDAERTSAREELAGRCGYWCGALPEELPFPEALEREVHELTGDETLSSIDDEDTGSDETAPTDPADLRWWPTSGDLGYELVEVCGAGYFGLPADGGIVLLDESNFVDLVYLGYLGELLSGIETDLIRGEALTVMASEVIAHFVSTFLGGVVRQDLTPAAYQYDPRLELPAFISAGPHRSSIQVRIVALLSTGVHLATRPSLQLSRSDEGGFAISYAEEDVNLHYPGEAVVPFSRLNRVEAAVIEDGRLLGLESRIREYESTLARLGWRSPIEGGDSSCDVEPGSSVSVFADGSTRVDVFLATLASLTWCGYDDVSLHVLHPDGGVATLPVEVRLGGVDGPHHGVTAHGRSLELTRWSDADEEAEGAISLARRSDASLVNAYRHLHEWSSADLTVPVVVSVTDMELDWGVLANTLMALSFERSLPEDVDRDLTLLSAPILDDGNGGPAPLFSAGLILQVGR